MFCFKCGKEIVDEAIVCPYCGCATNNYKEKTNTNTNHSYSNDYVAIKNFSDEAKNYHTLGVLSAIFFLGIGIIFSIIMMFKKPQIPEITTTNPNEIAELESAKRKVKNADVLSSLPFFAIALVGVGVMISMFFW